MLIVDGLSHWNTSRNILASHPEDQLAAIAKVKEMAIAGLDVTWAVKNLGMVIADGHEEVRLTAMDTLVLHCLKTGNHMRIEELLNDQRANIRDATVRSLYYNRGKSMMEDLEPHIRTLRILLLGEVLGRTDRQVRSGYEPSPASAATGIVCNYYYLKGDAESMKSLLLASSETVANDISNWFLNNGTRQVDKNSDFMLDMCIALLDGSELARTYGARLLSNFALAKNILLDNRERMEKIAAALGKDYITTHALTDAIYFLADEKGFDITPVLPKLAELATPMATARTPGKTDFILLDSVCAIFVGAAKRRRDVSSGVGFMTTLLGTHVSYESRYSKPATMFFRAAASMESVNISSALPQLESLSQLPRYMAARWGSPNAGDLNEDVRANAAAALVNYRNRGKHTGALQDLVLPTYRPGPQSGPKGKVLA